MPTSATWIQPSSPNLHVNMTSSNKATGSSISRGTRKTGMMLHIAGPLSCADDNHTQDTGKKRSTESRPSPQPSPMTASKKHTTRARRTHPGCLTNTSETSRLTDIRGADHDGDRTGGDVTGNGSDVLEASSDSTRVRGSRDSRSDNFSSMSVENERCLVDNEDKPGFTVSELLPVRRGKDVPKTQESGGGVTERVSLSTGAEADPPSQPANEDSKPSLASSTACNNCALDTGCSCSAETVPPPPPPLQSHLPQSQPPPPPLQTHLPQLQQPPPPLLQTHLPQSQQPPPPPLQTHLPQSQPSPPPPLQTHLPQSQQPPAVTSKRRISFMADSVLTAVIQDGDTAELVRILTGRHGPGLVVGRRRGGGGEGGGGTRGVDVRQTNHVGLTALHHAVLAHNLDAAKLLLCHGADVNAQDVHGFSPLHTAAACDSLPLTSLFLLFGADVFSLTSEHELPIDVARDLSVVRVLAGEMTRLVQQELWLASVLKAQASDLWLLVRKVVACLLLFVLYLVTGVRTTWKKRHRKSD